MKITLDTLQKSNEIPFELTVDMGGSDEVTVVKSKLTAKAVDYILDILSAELGSEEEATKYLSRIALRGLPLDESKELIGTVTGVGFNITSFVKEYNLNETVLENLTIEVAKAMVLAYIDDLNQSHKEGTTPIE